jgi:hypothetical protein
MTCKNNFCFFHGSNADAHPGDVRVEPAIRIDPGRVDYDLTPNPWQTCVDDGFHAGLYSNGFKWGEFTSQTCRNLLDEMVRKIDNTSRRTVSWVAQPKNLAEHEQGKDEQDATDTKFEASAPQDNDRHAVTSSV